MIKRSVKRSIRLSRFIRHLKAAVMGQFFTLLFFVLLDVDPVKLKDMLLFSSSASKQEVVMHHVDECLLLYGVRFCRQPFICVLKVSVKDDGERLIWLLLIKFVKDEVFVGLRTVYGVRLFVMLLL